MLQLSARLSPPRQVYPGTSLTSSFNLITQLMIILTCGDRSLLDRSRTAVITFVYLKKKSPGTVCKP